jgi:hypothetical protein
MDINKTLLNLLLENMKEGKTDTEQDIGNGEICIAILQRGWVYVGNYYRNGDNCRLENASCIRNWGTTKGLGEIAESGATSSTKLDACPTVYFHRMGEICVIECNKKNWKK